VRDRRRPRLRTVFVLVHASLLALPLVGIAALRVYESVLVRRTEGELLAQAVVLSAAFRHEVRSLESTGGRLASREVPPGSPPGDEVDPEGRYHPLVPRLDLRTDPVLPDGPEPVVANPPDAVAWFAGQRLQSILNEAEDRTLAGLRIVDPSGVVVASTTEAPGSSVADRVEVARALRGERASVLRHRTAVAKAPFDSISRTATIRVVVAIPIVDGTRLLGAVVATRTPPSAMEALWRMRRIVVVLAGALLSVAVVVALLTTRLVARPLEELTRRAERVARGFRETAAPLETPGTREVARLSEAVSGMSHALEARAGYVTSLAASVSHEFKTPLASMRAAAELLRDHHDDMSPEERERFLENVGRDADRLGRLVGRLVELAKFDMSIRPGARARVLEAVRGQASRQRELGLDVGVDAGPECEGVEAALPEEALAALLSNLLDNVRRHGGEGVHAHVIVRRVARGGIDGVAVTVADDGGGISQANRARVFEPFFTTARERGGTGLGLAIVRSIVEAARGSLELRSQVGRTELEAWLPRAPSPTA
jgi:signal transduction histidine kinase